MMSPSASFDASSPQILLYSPSPSAAVHGDYQMISNYSSQKTHKKQPSTLSSPAVGNFLSTPSSSLLNKKHSSSSANDHIFQIRKSSKINDFTVDEYENLLEKEKKESAVLTNEDPWALEKLLEDDEVYIF